MSLGFHLSGDDFDHTPRFEADGSLAHGQLQDSRLPFALTDLKAQVHCDNACLRIRDLSAHHGQTVWTVSNFEWQGFAADSPLELRASGKQVHLDRTWAAVLAQPWRTDWLNFDPDGEVDAEATLSFDGRQWKPRLLVTGRGNVSFSCHKFPYRLERATGTLRLEDKVLDVGITAYSGAQPITLSGRFWNPGPGYTGAIEMRGEKIPFDRRLYSAILKPKSREVLQSLDPQGTFNFHAQLWRDDPRIREMHQLVRIDLNGCAMNYEKFRYPLNNLHGTAELRDGQWKFPKLVGTNGSGVVTLSGRLDTSPTFDVLSVQISAKNVPLQEELRNALPNVSQQQLWDSLQPAGKINVEALVGYDSRTKKTAVELWAVPRDDAAPIGTSIEPITFPCRMRLVSGSVHYREGHVELENIHATHQNVDMCAQGNQRHSPGRKLATTLAEVDGRSPTTAR